MNKGNLDVWKADLGTFKEKTEEFYRGNMTVPQYKGFSGLYGSYAQKGGKASMLRLRMTAGRVTKEKLAFTAKSIKKYKVSLVHFTTCQTIQLHNLDKTAVCEIMEDALSCGIVTMGGGGDYPRNVMCSPLSGTEEDEYFDVMPYAEAAGEYLMGFVKAEKMPRKLKVCFSNSPKNLTHATFRDLGFAANENGKFDVYSAGGLGGNPKFGIKVAENIAPEDICYYIKAMWLMFRTYGNYTNRAKARTRYMQEVLGSTENYIKAYNEKLQEVLSENEDIKVYPASNEIKKTGDGGIVSGSRIIKQKQEGLYTVVWHPLGGKPLPETLCDLSKAIENMEEVEIRLAPDETAYIINLTSDEAKRILDITADGAKTVFEASVSCIGSSICQVGARDSQELLEECVKAVAAADIPDGALPQIHISGCPSSCGTHQTGALGFRGAFKKRDGKPQSAFMLYVGGCDRQGSEKMGHEAGTIFTEQIPEFLVKLGKIVADSQKNYEEWHNENPNGVDEAAEEFINAE